MKARPTAGPVESPRAETSWSILLGARNRHGASRGRAGRIVPTAVVGPYRAVAGVSGVAPLPYPVKFRLRV